MKLKAIIGAGIVAGAMLIGSAAGAAVNVDYTTGLGFVGKGDVKDALGLTEKQIQRDAAFIDFDLTATETFEVTCEVTEETITRAGSQGKGGGADNGLGRKIKSQVTREATTDIEEDVATEIVEVSRKNSQERVTGFNLTGLVVNSTIYLDGGAPEVGGNCTGEDADGTFQGQITEVDSQGFSNEMLTVRLGSGTAVPLPNTPAVV